MNVSYLFLFIFLNFMNANVIYEELNQKNIQDLSCFAGMCLIAEGCEGNPTWKRVFEWPKFQNNLTECLHALIIRRNIDTSPTDENEITEKLDEIGDEYFIGLASGGPDGPAREIRLENNRMKPIFSVTHDKIKFEKDTSPTMRWTIESYEYQKITDSFFEAGVLARILKVDMWADLCLFVHSSRSMQHLCSGLERIFLRIPSSQFPMKYDDCQDGLDSDSFEVDKYGFFKCKTKIIDRVLNIGEIDGMKLVQLHNVFCVAGKTQYLVEHHLNGFLSLKFDKRQDEIKCGDNTTQIKDRCEVPSIPDDVSQYCGVRCEKGGKTVNGDEAVLRCDFMDAVIDGKVYKSNRPEVSCDPTGWWTYQDPNSIDNSKKWVSSIYCFYPHSAVFSDCILDRFICGQYGECPLHRQHQVDCDGNKEGLVLAVFHPGLLNGYTQVKKLGCDIDNGWWTVDGKSLPHTAIVDCVWPIELEILRRAAEREDYEPAKVDPRALSDIGPTVRTASVIVAVIAAILFIGGLFVVNYRLHGPKTRMVTRQLRSLYPSLLNEEERMDKSKAELEYRSVDCESAGLALHQINKLLDGDCSSLQLHNHWIKLNWPNRNLLLERTLLHRAFFGLKVLYDKFKLQEGQTFEQARPGLKEKIIKASKKYKTFTEKWSSLDFQYSLAFATLSKAELDAFRRNEVKRKVLRPQPAKEQSQMEAIATDAPGTDLSKKTVSNDGSIPVVKTAKTPTLDETPTTGQSTGKGGEKIEEKTAPPVEKE
uniref:Uncharacterized protein n=1 Tax=Pristionchus pacificus TaxID=54126 RepID=A0A8R1Z9L3_PRIPA